jgi:hypothetical protein
MTKLGRKMISDNIVFMGYADNGDDDTVGEEDDARLVAVMSLNRQTQILIQARAPWIRGTHLDYWQLGDTNTQDGSN